jgi:hypothetical protein
MTSKAINHSTGRRSFIKGAAFSTAVAAIPATIATASSGVPTQAGADQPLVDAEAEITRLLGWYDAHSEAGSEDDAAERQPALDRANDLDNFVSRARPATIVGAAVKLRRLLDIDLGIATGDRDTDMLSFLQILGLLHNIGGAPNHPTRPCGSPFDDDCRVEGTAALAPPPATDDPIFAMIAERNRVKALLNESDARCRAIAAAWPTLCAAPDGVTRDADEFRAWEAAFERDSEHSGYRRAAEENEALSDKVVDLENALLLTPATALAGAFAKLAVLRKTNDFDPENDIQDAFILCLFDDFERLLPGSAVAA